MNLNPNRCRHLRTKKMFTIARPDEAFAVKNPEEATPSHFWCNLTQSVVGPDDRQAHPDSCSPGRSCYEE
jgi:hypothetical protein